MHEFTSSILRCLIFQDRILIYSPLNFCLIPSCFLRLPILPGFRIFSRSRHRAIWSLVMANEPFELVRRQVGTVVVWGCLGDVNLSRDVLTVCQLCHTVLTFDFEASATSASTNVQADMSGWCHATLLRLSHGVRSRRLEVNQQSSQVKALSSRWLGKEMERVRERNQFRINSRVPSWSIPDFPNCFFGRVSSFLVILSLWISGLPTWQVVLYTDQQNAKARYRAAEACAQQTPRTSTKWIESPIESLIESN